MIPLPELLIPLALWLFLSPPSVSSLSSASYLTRYKPSSSPCDSELHISAHLCPLQQHFTIFTLVSRSLTWHDRLSINGQSVVIPVCHLTFALVTLHVTGLSVHSEQGNNNVFLCLCHRSKVEGWRWFNLCRGAATLTVNKLASVLMYISHMSNIFTYFKTNQPGFSVEAQTSMVQD